MPQLFFLTPPTRCVKRWATATPTVSREEIVALKGGVKTSGKGGEKEDGGGGAFIVDNVIFQLTWMCNLLFGLEVVPNSIPSMKF